METKDFIQFIENLSIVKDVEKKSELIKNELKQLNKMIKEKDDQDYSSRIEKIENQSEYLEILTFKNVLSFRLSLLQSKPSIQQDSV
jgi:hypothetical protein